MNWIHCRRCGRRYSFREPLWALGQAESVEAGEGRGGGEM
jgi:hypothetical protein